MKKTFFFMCLLCIVFSSFFVSAEYPSGFTKCKNLTINYPAASTLTNFPIKLNITFDSDMQADFDDLRFYAGGCGGTGGILYAELESMTASTNAYVWVKNNVSTGIVVAMYYGNSTISSSWDFSGNVWDSSFTGVNLLNGSNDSTSNEYNGVVTEAVASSGAWGGAYYFDGVNDKIVMTNPFYWQNNTNITMSAWIRHTAYGASDVFFRWLDTASTPKGGLQLQTGSAGQEVVTFVLSNGTARLRQATGNVIANNTWVYVTIVLETGNNVAPTEIYYYANGALYANVNVTDTTGYYVTTPDATTNGAIGSTGSATWFTGYIDELMVSNTRRSDDWINFSYQLGKNHATFVTYGSEQNSSSDPCVYSGSGDFVVSSHCDLVGVSYNVCPNIVNITSTGWINLSGNSVLNASKVVWSPKDADEIFRLRWYSGSKVRWGSC